MTLRTIRESSTFKVQRDELGFEIRRLDEVLEAAMWAIAGRAEQFPVSPSTGLRVVLSQPFRNVPALRVYFRIIDADYVDLEWIEVDTEDSTEPVG